MALCSSWSSTGKVFSRFPQRANFSCLLLPKNLLSCTKNASGLILVASQHPNAVLGPVAAAAGAVSTATAAGKSSASGAHAHTENAAIHTRTEADQRSKRLEERIERAIFDCRFLTLLGVVGSLAGSLLCFVKGSLFVLRSFSEYFSAVWHGVDTEVILLLVEAVDIYLMGTVMLIFGMGLYELFVSTLEIPEENQPPGTVQRSTVCGSNLFGLFRLQERPKWLEIRSLDELKTKLGHVIVMILLVGMFEKSKKIVITTGLDLVCLSASILFSSGCLYLLSKLHQN